MEILGGLLLVTVLLAMLGSVTVLAFASMALLGLVTEMSFKRVFFASFAIGLLAPILLAGWVSTQISEESVQLELLTELNDAVSGSENVVEALPRIRDLRQQLVDGTITQEEFEAALEQLIEERTGAQVELEGIEVTSDVTTDAASGVTTEVAAQADQVSEAE